MKRSNFCLYVVDVLVIALISLNAIDVWFKTYCIHDIEISAWLMLTIMAFTAGALVFKWKETKIS